MIVTANAGPRRITVILIVVVLGISLLAVGGRRTAQATGGAGDHDHDWCTNQQELGPSHGAGGQRDPKNPWDYFEPTHDRRIRIEDVIAVIGKYRQDRFRSDGSINPAYDQAVDRSAGTNSWAPGPPDGIIRLNDVTAVLGGYRDDCPLPISHSWYVTNYHVNPEKTCTPPGSSNCIALTMVSVGHDDGMSDSATCTDSVVALNFGQPDYLSGQYGANYHTNFGLGYQFLKDDDIEVAAESYAYGWWHATSSCPKLKLVIGTNNSDLTAVTSDGGSLDTAASKWATVVLNVQTYLHTSGFDGQIMAWGGSDMEQPDGTAPADWSCFALTKEFVDHYNQPGALPFVDYGTANLPNLKPNGDNWCSQAQGIWDEVAVHSVASGAELALPELYNTSNPGQWLKVELLGGAMYFDGVTTTDGYLSPMSAEQDLWIALRGFGVEQDYFPYATNFACLAC